MKVDYYMIYLTKSIYIDFDIFNGMDNYTVYENSIGNRYIDFATLAIF